MAGLSLKERFSPAPQSRSGRSSRSPAVKSCTWITLWPAWTLALEITAMAGSLRFTLPDGGPSVTLVKNVHLLAQRYHVVDNVEFSAVCGPVGGVIGPLDYDLSDFTSFDISLDDDFQITGSNFAAMLCAHFRNQKLNQIRNVFLMLSQRRHVNVEDIQPVIKIAAQFS